MASAAAGMLMWVSKPEGTHARFGHWTAFKDNLAREALICGEEGGQRHVWDHEPGPPVPLPVPLMQKCVMKTQWVIDKQKGF